MTIENIIATARGVDRMPGKGNAGNIKIDMRRASASATAEAGSTYTFGRFPSNIRLLHDLARIQTHNSVATTTTIKNKIGLFGVDGNIIDDDDALFPSFAVNTSYQRLYLVSTVNDVFDHNKQLWEYVSGLTKDPGGEIDIKVTFFGGTASENIGAIHTQVMTVVYGLD